MTARLYQFFSSPFCAKARKILEFKGVEHEVVEVDYLERKELLLASEQLYVPALTLAGGETIVDSTRIAMRMEELYPEPTILPPGWRGLHIALNHYFDNQLEVAIFPLAIADEAAHYRRQGKDREAFWRLIRERKYGAGFVDRVIAAEASNRARAMEALEPLEDALKDKAFLLGRIGLADFALYGQLFYFAFTGEQKLPAQLKNLRAFFDRIDRISSVVATEPA